MASNLCIGTHIPQTSAVAELLCGDRYGEGRSIHILTLISSTEVSFAKASPSFEGITAPVCFSLIKTNKADMTVRATMRLVHYLPIP